MGGKDYIFPFWLVINLKFCWVNFPVFRETHFRSLLETRWLIGMGQWILIVSICLWIENHQLIISRFFFEAAIAQFYLTRAYPALASCSHVALNQSVINAASRTQVWDTTGETMATSNLEDEEKKQGKKTTLMTALM